MDAWLSLFGIAMDVLDDTPPGLIGDDWTIGGGTMLYRRFGHRLSKDIDIFLTSPQMLPALSPRLNTMAEARSRSYVEQSNYVKLVFAAGEIDFIVAPHLLTPYATREDIEGGRSGSSVRRKFWRRRCFIVLAILPRATCSISPS